MFKRDPFNIAPRRGRTRLFWLSLVSGLALAGLAVDRTVGAVDHKPEGALSEKKVATPDPLSLERALAVQKLEASLNVGLPPLLDAIERAGSRSNGRVSIFSLTQSEANESGALVRLSGMAFTHDTLLEYIESLQGQPGVQAATMVQQEAIAAQEPGTRFQIDLRWQPQRRAPNVAGYPGQPMYLADMRSVFKVAHENGMAFKTVSYEGTRNIAADVVLQHAVLNGDAEYSKLKSALSQLPAAIPNLRVDRLQVVQATDTARQGPVRFTARITLLYGTSGGSVAAPATHAVIPGSTRNPVSLDPFAPMSSGLPAALGEPKKPAAVKPPKQPDPAPTPAPEPTAPPLPFTLVGALREAAPPAGAPVVFLQHGGELLTVRAGESIGSTYRVEAISPQRIDFVYLPLMQRQSLALAP